MDLGIVVVSYNTRQLTADCLRSVYEALEAERLAAQVCVVDNASGDGSAEMIGEVFPQAHLIASAENLGFARGTNLGIDAMLRSPDSPRHVLLLNPDTLVRPDALTEMVLFLDTHPQVGAAGARLSYGDGSFQHSAFHFPTLLMTFFDFWAINHRLINSRLNGRYPQHLYEAGEPFPIDHPLGAALMIRRETLAQVGPLDEGFFMYCEEIDWCIRAKRAGWNVYCIPQAHIIHLGGQSTGQFRDRMFVALWRSRFRLFEKHYSRAYTAAVRLILKAGLARRARQVRLALAAGAIDQEAADKQLYAYRTVLEL